jgi:hypothetical protein
MAKLRSRASDYAIATGKIFDGELLLNNKRKKE